MEARSPKQLSSTTTSTTRSISMGRSSRSLWLSRWVRSSRIWWPRLPWPRWASRTMRVRCKTGQQEVVVDHAAMVDEEDMSILKVRRDTGMKDLEVVEALEDEEEEDTQVDGETTVAEDLLPLVVQVEWVGST